MIEYPPGKLNLVADALSQKSSSVATIQAPTVLTLARVELECMKDDYADSVDFSTPYALALVGEQDQYTL